MHQRTCQVQAHAPTAGKTCYRALQCVIGETQPVQQLRSARLGDIAIEGFVAMLRLEPGRVVLFLRQRFFEQAQLDVAIKHEFQRGLIRSCDFLFDKSNGLARLKGDFAAVGLDFAAYQAEQRGFAAAVFADQTDALVAIRLQINILEQWDTALQVSQILDIEHGRDNNRQILKFGPGRFWGVWELSGDWQAKLFVRNKP